MMLDGVTPPPVESADPTWYLVLDLIGTWLGALGTAAATGVAVWLGLRALRDQRAQQEERERAQAEHVILVRRPGNTEQPPYVTVRNESDQLISAVRVVALGSYRNEVFDRDLMQAGQGMDAVMTGLKEPGNAAAVEFDDAAGRTWVRTADGVLQRSRRQPEGSSLHLRYNQLAYEHSTLSSITVSLPHGAMLLAWKKADEHVIEVEIPKSWRLRSRWNRLR